MTLPDKPIKVALLDDEQLFLQGLELIVAKPSIIDVVLSCTDADSFFERLPTLAELPDIVLLDIRMKPVDGFGVAERLGAEYPDIRIIVLSSYYEKAFFGHMVKLGAAAFLPKNSSQELLQEAIFHVHETGVFFTEQDRQLLVSFMKTRPKAARFTPENPLTEREVEVVQLICAEYTNVEIAEKLILSKRTIESHRQRILEKTGAKNTVGIVIYAIVHDLYTPAHPVPYKYGVRKSGN